MSEVAYLGGGCFWCLDAIYQSVKGVESVVVGYSGGTTDNPTYDQLHDEDTGHAEISKITFNPKTISYETVLEIFWYIHDPTTLNRQGNDVGKSYRSIILCEDENQFKRAEKSKVELGQTLWDDQIVTEIKILEKFYEAEDYHQDYFNKNPQAGYCQVVINPKLEKFRTHFSDVLK